VLLQCFGVELSDFCQHLDRSAGKRLTDDGHPVRQQDFSFPVTLSGRSVEEGLVEELETLSKKERDIIAYLLHHKQRMFTCAIDGGHAATLISSSIVRRALNQVFEFDDMPVEMPLEVWRFLRENVDQFPYEGDEDELEPLAERLDGMSAGNPRRSKPGGPIAAQRGRATFPSGLSIAGISASILACFSCLYA
jgi:hypothetical protein